MPSLPPIVSSSLDLDALAPDTRAAFEALRAQVSGLNEDITLLSEHNVRLEHLVGELRQALYGRPGWRVGRRAAGAAGGGEKCGLAHSSMATAVLAPPR